MVLGKALNVPVSGLEVSLIGSCESTETTVTGPQGTSIVAAAEHHRPHTHHRKPLCCLPELN